MDKYEVKITDEALADMEKIYGASNVHMRFQERHP